MVRQDAHLERGVGAACYGRIYFEAPRTQQTKESIARRVVGRKTMAANSVPPNAANSSTSSRLLLSFSTPRTPPRSANAPTSTRAGASSSSPDAACRSSAASFSYVLGDDGVEKFVATPELQSENTIGTDPSAPGQVWTISSGGEDEHPELFRIEINTGPGSGVKVISHPTPKPFQESVRYAEQNLYARAKDLVGDRDPRGHEFTVQLRSFDASRSGHQVGVPVLVALCSGLLQKHIRGGLIVVGGVNLGGSLEPIYNAVSIVELAVEKGATAVLMPVTCRRELNDLSGDMATKIDVQFYADTRDALLKAITE